MDKGSITIFIFCLGMANSLECHKCLINEGNCSQAPVEVCRTNQDACFTVIKKYHGLSADTAKQGCGSSNNCRRYPMGMVGSLFRTMWCCSSNLCQPIHLSVKRDGLQNGLVCQSCIGDTTECSLTAPLRQCYGSADRCVQISQRFLPENYVKKKCKCDPYYIHFCYCFPENGSTAVTIQKGCATESMCRRDTDIYLRLKRENTRAECCKRNLCNKAHSPTSPQLVTILSLWLVLKVYQ
ncbi:phospholipase A2 inhibitor subunit gamma B-like [Notechis scutatus]|uniref:Phospholipase A2 inhibitor subunit gamma B-like n=1 Tax=Notechis scutatus TaxID=8663 RepID=A0A6J1V1V0_9SAUR|nr:phospholipase A2 inhibitor subunit gamma B-like [Notechis scutatus]